ncbi:DUF4123 domain-containing protein [Pseudomonas sp. C1C7]|uniref:DUF4123 domain-containing protein n=1 Tax=Pseudomonas sp. C1C7 TaxID=2735272 RepID=UPI0015864997|nr:DUF4123 domain-containing protein [Pseudomonas sp. C1C7]NUT75916.1 DUF4123 domain-containing protein [Pseudomonas sp. C1C7]
MSLSTSLPENLPWGEQQAYALLDGATLSNLADRIKQANHAALTLALYDQPPFSALRDVSPLLVVIEKPDDPMMQFFVHHAPMECGVLLFSPVQAHVVAEHLRKLLTVELSESSSVLLRLADAAVMRALLSSADQSLFGPMSWVVTADCVNSVWHSHQPRRPECPALLAPYRLDPAQIAALDQVDHRRSLIELDAHLLSHFPQRHSGESLAQRWAGLEQLETEASALGLQGQSELFYYANLMAWLDGDIDQYPRIRHLLHTPTLQSPGERVALAAALAHEWASERDLS